MEPAALNWLVGDKVVPGLSSPCKVLAAFAMACEVTLPAVDADVVLRFGSGDTGLADGRLPLCALCALTRGCAVVTGMSDAASASICAPDGMLRR